MNNEEIKSSEPLRKYSDEETPLLLCGFYDAWLENEDYCRIAHEAWVAALLTAQNELTLYHDLQLKIELIKDRVQCGRKECCIYMVGTEATFKLCHELKKMNRDLLDYFGFNKCLTDLLPYTRFRFRCHLRIPPTGEVTILKQIEGKDISCQELMNESISLVDRIEEISEDMASCMSLTERKASSESSNAIVKSLKDLTTELHSSFFSDVKDPDKVAATIDNRWSQLDIKSEELADQSRRFIASLEKPIENPQANTMDLENQENNNKRLLELVEDTREFINKLEKQVCRLEEEELKSSLIAEGRKVFYEKMPRCEIERDFTFPTVEEGDYGPSGKVRPKWAFEIRTFDLAKALRWAIDSETGNPSFSKPNGEDENSKRRQEKKFDQAAEEMLRKFNSNPKKKYSAENLYVFLLGLNFNSYRLKPQKEIAKMLGVSEKTIRNSKPWKKMKEIKKKPATSRDSAWGIYEKNCIKEYKDALINLEVDLKS